MFDIRLTTSSLVVASLLHGVSAAPTIRLHSRQVLEANSTTTDTPAANSTGASGPSRRPSTNAQGQEGTGSTAEFVMEDLYAGDDIFAKWSWFTGPDPTNGPTAYQPKDAAVASKLAFTDDQGYAIISVDDKTTLQSGEKRPSVRLTSDKSYNVDKGSLLFIADFQAMPSGCSVWPAFWLVGPEWPNKGEIDILEGVNTGTKNQYTLHTKEGCTLSTPETSFSGKKGESPECSVGGDKGNSGCAIFDQNDNSFGKGLETTNGAVYATLWDAKEGIKIWYFPGSEIPQDIAAGKPDPKSWPMPTAFFGADTCTMDHFGDMNMVLNTAIGGDWAGGAFAASGCPGTLEETVMDPTKFADAKWKTNYIATYRSGGSGSSNSTTSPASSNSTADPASSAGSAVPSSIAGSSTVVEEGAPSDVGAPAATSSEAENVEVSATAIDGEEASTAASADGPSAAPTGAPDAMSSSTVEDEEAAIPEGEEASATAAAAHVPEAVATGETEEEGL